MSPGDVRQQGGGFFIYFIFALFIFEILLFQCVFSGFS